MIKNNNTNKKIAHSTFSDIDCLSNSQKLTSVHWDKLVCKLGLGIFVDYTVVGLSYQWIIQITNLPKNVVKSNPKIHFSHSLCSLFILFFASHYGNFTAKPKDFYVSGILQWVWVNQTAQPHMSVIQEKMKSVGYPVAI